VSPAAGHRRLPPSAAAQPHARVLGRRIKIRRAGFNPVARAARKRYQPLDPDPMDLNQPDPSQLGQTRPDSAILQKSPYVSRNSQKYPSTLESFLQFSPFSLF
jgi:hypothetical protein